MKTTTKPDQQTAEQKNAHGRAQGYSGCNNCGGTWDWKEGHSTTFMEGSGMFPLCEECWASMTVEQRLPHYRSVAMWWGEDGRKWWPLIERAVRKEGGEDVPDADPLEAILSRYEDGRATMEGTIRLIRTALLGTVYAEEDKEDEREIKDQRGRCVGLVFDLN